MQIPGKQFRLIAGLTIVALVIVGLTLAAPAIHRQLDRWKLLPQPERLTELYFSDHTKLPTTYTPGNQQTVKFTIHNLEYRPTHYHYHVLQQNIDGSGVPQVLEHGEVTLQQGQYFRPVLVITPLDLGPRVKITVMLEGRSEAIDYLLNKEGV